MARWQSVGASLVRLRTSSTEDTEALAGLCPALDDARVARLALGTPVVDSRGRVVCEAGVLTYMTETTDGIAMMRPRPEVTITADRDRRIHM
jgi:hypothetical protein